MYKIYKITNTKITETKNGNIIFNLELNNTIWASKNSGKNNSAFYIKKEQEHEQLLHNLRNSLIESGVMQKKTIKKTPIPEKKDMTIHELYDNYKTLNSLIGQFITTSLVKSNYGTNFDNILSYNSLKDFKELLDNSKKRAFISKIPIYSFLKEQGYNINIDGSITLRQEYDSFNIRERYGEVICYPNNLGTDRLTFENIEIIYNNFYKDKEDCMDSETRSCSYYLREIAISIICNTYTKHMGECRGSQETSVLKIGDKLTDEMIKFLVKSHSY